MCAFSRAFQKVRYTLVPRKHRRISGAPLFGTMICYNQYTQEAIQLVLQRPREIIARQPVQRGDS